MALLDLLLTLTVLASTCFTILLLCAPSRYIRHSPPQATGEPTDRANHEPKVSVKVLVLGDIGRSPRMTYHAMSIARHGGRVDMIGYVESQLPQGLVDNRLITIHPLPPAPSLLRRLPFLLAAPLKVTHQSLHLFRLLAYSTRPSRWMLVQNPPSIPTLAIAFTVCFLRNTHLIIDWHNYGFTILAGTKGVSHPVVKISKTYEQLLGRCAPTLNLTVTDAMARDLRGEGWGIRSPILVMHDRPAGIFRPIESNAERRAFLEKLEETKDHADDIMAGKTRLLVSSTSWTPDEDFGLLLDALVAYASSRRQSRPPSGALPPILAIITGKGPQKESYLARIAALTAQGKLQGVTVQTAFLSLPDYALLLACADLGVCLHKSSSGVDLPMKVVDMFGCGLPVAGYSAYPSWPELVTEGVNGRGFVDSEGLMKVLVDLFGKGKGELDVLRLGAIEEGRRRWDGEWEGVVGRVLGLVE